MTDGTGPSIFKRIDNFVRGVANGMTFGAADYIAGAADTAVKGGSIGKNIKIQAAKSQQAAIEGPEFFAGEIAGALTDGAAAAVKTAGGLSNAARTIHSYGELRIIAETAASGEQKVESLTKLINVSREINAAAATGLATTSGAMVASTSNNMIVENAVVGTPTPPSAGSPQKIDPPPRLKAPVPSH
jgi:hypothetical protein